MKLDEYAVKWERNLDKGAAFLHPLIPIFIDYLTKEKKLSGELLDLGCGKGDKSRAFSTLGFNVTGIDSSSERIEQAKKKCPSGNFYCFKFQDRLPFDDDSFDIIFSFSFFQYIDHTEILRECKRILKEDGCLVLIENLKNNPITYLGRVILKASNYNYQSFPYNHLTYDEIKNIGLQFCNSSHYFFHFMTPLAKAITFTTNYSADPIYSFLSKVDRFILKIAYLKRFCWFTLFICENKKSE